jgi:hypothetical protein
MNKKKNIIFINMEPPYKLKADTLLMAAPYTTALIQQVLVYDTELHVRTLASNNEETRSNNSNMDDDDSDGDQQQGGGENEQEETTLQLCSESFDKLYDDAHTVVLPDALFSERSKIFKTTAFMQHGMEALGKFYKKNGGGRVVVMCLEGGLSNAVDNMNRLFDTSWALQYFEASTTVLPTPLARRLFGPYVPQQYNVHGMPYFISCPKGEGLFQQLMSDKERFVEDFHAEDEAFERLGIEKDESMDCFNVEKSWTNYVKKYTDRYYIALHVDHDDNSNKEENSRNEGGGGQVVWFGDRGQSDGLAFIFCKLFILDQILERQQQQQQHQSRVAALPVNASTEDDDDAPALSLFAKARGPSATLFLSILGIILALATRYVLGRQQ